MANIIRLTKDNLRQIFVEQVFKTFNVIRKRKQNITEVKYFHPSGLKHLPNGSHYQKGGFLHECRKNACAFVLSEDIHPEQYGSDHRGGIIVFSSDVNAPQLSDNKVLHKMNIDTDDFIGAYSIGNFFKGKYVSDNGQVFSDKSLAIEVNGLSSKGIIRLAKILANDFVQQTVLVKNLNINKIYLTDCCIIRKN